MYRHRFVLVGGDEVVTYSRDEDIPTYRYGDIVTFVSNRGKCRMTIPVLSILYVETEEISDEEAKELCSE
jgi:hypothetical protein